MADRASSTSGADSVSDLAKGFSPVFASSRDHEGGQAPPGWDDFSGEDLSFDAPKTSYVDFSSDPGFLARLRAEAVRTEKEKASPGKDNHLDSEDEDSSDVTPLLTPPSMDIQEPSPAGAAEEMGVLDHCHSHSAALESIRQQGVAKVKKKLMAATVFCLIFAIGEGFGGYFSGSYAIVSDAAHMLSDFANLVIGLIAVSVAGVAPKRGFNFGLIRAEAVGALFSVLLIWNLAGVLLYESLVRIVQGEFEIQSTPMLIAGGCAVFFNIFMVLFLRGVPHSHSHGPSLFSTNNNNNHSGHAHFHNEGEVEDEPHSHHQHSSLRHHLNIRAATVHALGDVFQSTGVFIVSIIIKFYPDYKILDPVCSILFCGIVIYTTVNVFWDTVKILMEGFPKNLRYEDVEGDLAGIKKVVRVHDLRMWSLTSDKNALSVHLAVEANTDGEAVVQEATRMMRKKYSVAVVTVQVESFKANVMDTCDQCQPLK